MTPNCGDERRTRAERNDNECNIKEILLAHVTLPAVPFQKARGPSSTMIFFVASQTPLYVVCPVRATTCNLVLMTSAGVTKEAAGTPAIAPAASNVRGWL